ncbi:MAG: alpha/beta hydrolase [Alphaproteobacteria bacterium]|nr:alpha/beta hydrolase [Alphaproteobacteria bacterium]
MKRLCVNGHDMAYLDIGEGAPLVCVHGSLCDFRTWGPVLGPLSRRHRLIVPSLRRFFPEAWDGVGPGFTIAEHTADMIAFIERLDLGRVDLMGHSRGGHISFRIAQQRPELLRRAVLAEPGGDLDESFTAAGGSPSTHAPLRAHVAAAAEKIRAGDVEGGLASFLDAIEGPGAWQRLAAGARRQFRDNALTLLGQVNEQRPPYGRAEAEAIRVPTLLIGGTETQGSLPQVLRGLAAHIPGARVAMIPAATHMMFEQDPERFCAAVLDFLDAR